MPDATLKGLDKLVFTLVAVEVKVVLVLLLLVVVVLALVAASKFVPSPSAPSVCVCVCVCGGLLIEASGWFTMSSNRRNMESCEVASSEAFSSSFLNTVTTLTLVFLPIEMVRFQLGRASLKASLPPPPPPSAFSSLSSKML